MALHGKLGNDIFDSTALVNLETLTMDRIANIEDTPAMGDDFVTRLAGLTDFTITAEGKSQIGLDTLALLGDTGTNITVIEETNASYSAAAIISEFTETATVDGAISMSYTIAGNDATGLVYAASGTGGGGSSLEIHGKNLDAIHDTGTPASFSEIRGWSITGSVALSDTTIATATSSGMLKIAGLKSFSATVTVLTPVTDLDLIVKPGDTLDSLELWRKDATVAYGMYAGVAVCTNTNTGINVTGETVTVISFVYDGTVTFAKI